LRVPLVDLRAQYRSIGPDVDAAIDRVVANASFILGDEVARFEAEFATYVNAGGAVGVSSGTTAIELALRALGVGPGDEVITTAHTFIATAEAINAVGARPVFADIDPATFNIDPDHVEALITDRTRALLPVHLYGQPAAIEALMELAERRGLWVIEDAAQAVGAEANGRRCGSIGHLACFSFYPGKNLGAYGDAGAVTSNDTDVLAKVRRLRDHGRTTKYEHVELGLAARIDALQAAILMAKLPYLEEWTEARRTAAARYRQLLDGVEVVLPQEGEHVRHVYHLFVVRSDRRDALLDHLNSAGIGAGVHYPIPLHRQPAYAALGYGEISLPHTEEAAEQVLSLPIYPEITDEQLAYVADAVRDFLA
jgi:dTDP-4-amino-4,6-dideoxygalactose transaminase